MYRLLREQCDGDGGSSGGSSGSRSNRDVKFNLFGSGEDDVHRGSAAVRRTVIHCYAVAASCLCAGWMIGTWNLYGNLIGEGFVWKADMVMLGGQSNRRSSNPHDPKPHSNPNVQQSVGTVSMLVVGLSSLLFVCLPPLLSVDVGTKRTSNIAGKLFVLHAAGTVAAECLLLPHVLGRVGGSSASSENVLRSTVHVFVTSLCGVTLAWYMSRKSSSRTSGRHRRTNNTPWFRSLPIQDSWMAACIYASKMASLLPADTRKSGNQSSEVGAALGTFCMLATLTAPFVWYDPPVDVDDVYGTKPGEVGAGGALR